MYLYIIEVFDFVGGVCDKFWVADDYADYLIVYVCHDVFGRLGGCQCGHIIVECDDENWSIIKNMKSVDDLLNLI